MPLKVEIEVCLYLFITWASLDGTLAGYIASRDGLVREKALFLLRTEPPYLGPAAHSAFALPTIEGRMDTHVSRFMLLQTARTWGQRK